MITNDEYARDGYSGSSCRGNDASGVRYYHIGISVRHALFAAGVLRLPSWANHMTLEQHVANMTPGAKRVASDVLRAIRKESGR